MKSSELKETYLALLEAGKKSSDVPRSYETLLKKKNRGGLWTMEHSAVLMFTEVEKHFRIDVIEQPMLLKIDCQEIVHKLMKDCYILSLWSMLRNKCSLQVEKELSHNLLNDLLLLYIRARTFSHVKQKRDLFKLENKKQKMNSLKKTIKKASSVLDMGH